MLNLRLRVMRTCGRWGCFLEETVRLCLQVQAAVRPWGPLGNLHPPSAPTLPREVSALDPPTV